MLVFWTREFSMPGFWMRGFWMRGPSIVEAKTYRASLSNSAGFAISICGTNRSLPKMKLNLFDRSSAFTLLAILIATIVSAVGQSAPTGASTIDDAEAIRSEAVLAARTWTAESYRRSVELY